MTRRNKIISYQADYTPATIFIYVDNIALPARAIVGGRKSFLVGHFRQAGIAQGFIRHSVVAAQLAVHSPASSAYDYYNPSVAGEKAPITFEVKP
jgi:hypothetical protein